MVENYFFIFVQNAEIFTCHICNGRKQMKAVKQYNNHKNDKCPGCGYDHLYWIPQQLRDNEGVLLDVWALVSSQCPKCKEYYHYEFEIAQIKCRINE
jgi:hypothetical protein